MSRRTSRREFLGTAAAAGAGTWVCGRYAMSQNASPNEKLDVGIIGCAGRGEAHLEGMKGENIVALCDVDADNLGRAAGRFPKAGTYRDYRKMLEKEKLDAVVVATPDHHHAPASVMAMKLKRHVYCEKPLTHSIHEARVMTETAAKMKVATQMGNQGHSSPGVRRIVEIVRSGAIGPVREAMCWTNRPIWPQGLDRPRETPPVPPALAWDLWLGPAPERPYHPTYHPFAWRGWWDFGTGALGDMACHIMDGAWWALNLGSPLSAEAEGEPLHPECGPNWETIRMEFPARGDMPPLRFTWYDGKKTKEGKEIANLPPAELFEGEEATVGGTLLIGEKGKLYINAEYCDRYILLPRDKFKDYAPPEATIPDVPGHHEDWIAACKSGKTGGSHFGYGGPMTEAILVGVLAFRLGHKIQWDGAKMKAVNSPKADPLIRRKYRKGWTV